MTQVGIVLAEAAIPVLIAAAGRWLIWLPILAFTRQRLSRIGDRIANCVVSS